MRTQIVFTCRRCGKEQIENITFFNVLRFKFRNLVISEKYSDSFGNLQTIRTNSCELCSDCCKSLNVWLRNGNEYQELVNENNQLNNQKIYLNNERIRLQGELKRVSDKFDDCKRFCPRESPDYEEYCKWIKERIEKEEKK